MNAPTAASAAPSQKLGVSRLLALCGIGFLVLASYSVARPPSESLFLTAYGSDALPWVWLAVAIATLAVVMLYNRYATSVALSKLFAGSCFLSVGIFVAIRAAGTLWPRGEAFAQYVWKDIYIVVLVEIFWSYANTVFKLKNARWLYGMFLFAGTLGSFAGNIGVGLLANRTGVGSSDSIWFVVPLLLMAAFGFMGLTKGVETAPIKLEQKTPLSESFASLRGNRYLMLMVALICITQVVITLVDYSYNVVLEQQFPGTDERTEVSGWVYGAIDVGAAALQILSGLIMRGVGVGGTLLMIPVLLGAALGSWIVWPHFATMALSKVASKAFDYSVFRTAKELLYLPLTYAEKTQGKAVVDILTYRLSKAATSLLLLGLILLGSQNMAVATGLGGVIVWVFITQRLVHLYRQRRAT